MADAQNLGGCTENPGSISSNDPPWLNGGCQPGFSADSSLLEGTTPEKNGMGSTEIRGPHYLTADSTRGLGRDACT